MTQFGTVVMGKGENYEIEHCARAARNVPCSSQLQLEWELKAKYEQRNP